MTEPDSTQKMGSEPRYRFILNPYRSVRFTRCPGCDRLMESPRIPLLIHILPSGWLVMRKTVQHCPPCDLLIAHQDELELQIRSFLEPRVPEAAGNDYFVCGTLDEEDWEQGRAASAPVKQALECRRPFKEYLDVKVTRHRQPTEKSPSRKRFQRRKP
jgi:hypothetical protein